MAIKQNQLSKKLKFGAGEGAGDLLDTLARDEADTLTIAIPNQIIDDFDDTEKGTKVNCAQANSALALSSGQLSGSYERTKDTTSMCSQINGAMIASLQALAPKPIAVASDTFKFYGNVTSYFANGKKVIIATKKISDGETVHIFLTDAENKVAELIITSVTYSSMNDETSLVLANPGGLDLDMSVAAVDYTDDLRVIPFDYVSQVKTKTSEAYEDMALDTAAGLQNITISAPTGNWQEVGTLTGTVLSHSVAMSPNKQYGIAKVIEKTASNAILHIFYTSTSGSVWSKYSSTRVVSNTGSSPAEEYNQLAYQNTSSQIGVADNGKWSLVYHFQAIGSQALYGLYGDINAVSINDTAATPSDAGVTTPLAGRIFETGANWFGQCSIDSVDGSWMMVVARDSSGNGYFRSFTSGGAVHELLYTTFGSENTFNGILKVIGTGSSHRAIYAGTETTGVCKVTVVDQNNASLVYNTVIDSTGSGWQHVGGSLLNNRMILAARDYANNRFQFETGTVNGSPSFPIDQNKILSILDVDTYVGFSSSTNAHLNRYQHSRVVQNPVDEKHAFICADLVHPDGCRRATLFELSDVTDFKGIQISNYGGGSAASLRNISGQQRVSQSFTAGAGQRLRTFSLKGYQVGSIAAGNTLTAELQTASGGIPTGTVVATATNNYDPSKLTKSTSGQWLYFNFSNTALTNGQEYAIVVDGSFTINNTDYVVFLGSSGNAFAGDQRLYNGTTWVDNAATDFNIEVIGEWVTDIGNATHNTVNFEARDRHNFESQIVLNGSNSIKFITRKIKNPRFSTTENAFNKTGNLYSRDITINSPGIKATVGSLSQTGYDPSEFDENLILNVALGTDLCSRQDTTTGALSTTNKGEDRSGWNLSVLSYFTDTANASKWVNDASFQEGKALDFVGSSTTEGLTIGAGASGEPVTLTGTNTVFAIECEVKITSYSGSGGLFVAHIHSADSGVGWLFGITSTGHLQFQNGAGGTSIANNLPLSLGTKYLVKVVGDGTSIKLYRDGVEVTYSSQITSGYTLSGSVQGPANGVGIGAFNNTRAAGYQWVGRMGYIKIVRGVASFANVGFKNQAPLCGTMDAGKVIFAENKVGQNAESLGTNFDNIGFIAQGNLSIVDSYDLQLFYDHAIQNVSGNNLYYKLNLGRASTSDLSSVKGVIFRYSK